MTISNQAPFKAETSSIGSSIIQPLFEAKSSDDFATMSKNI